MEKTSKPISGYIGLLIFFAMVVISILLFALWWQPIAGAILSVLSFLMLFGFFIIYPNQAKVLTLFGAYKGTVRANGFFWVNPFYLKKGISLRARNFDSDRVKVNDSKGNPIMISVIMVWKVEDTYKAAFDVDEYEKFVMVQTDAAVRKLAGSYPYDNFEDEEAEITLRSGVNEINDDLERELSERLEIAGIEVLEARIGYLAYAEEIASAMLKRQQAEAIVAARYKIVEGAVGMVEDALERIKDKDIITFDEQKKASMVSNLMVVLCGDKDVSPVVNTGSLYQ